jgi:myo-inositol-1(or 4)-monophosphatase
VGGRCYGSVSYGAVDTTANGHARPGGLRPVSAHHATATVRSLLPPERPVSPPSSATEPVVARARTVIGHALDALGPRLTAVAGRVEVEPKADGTPVTDADRDADERLTRAIEEAFPDHGLLSEERDTIVPGTDWCWVLDPIDGTSNFVAGLPYWCVSVALTFEGQPVLGVIDAPALGRRYVATRHGGAWSEDRRLAVRGPVDWRDGRNRHIPVMLTTATARRARDAGLRLNARVMGATALDLAVVAEGVAAASVAIIPHVWDVAAGQLLVTEAGGAVVALGGEPLLPMRPGDDHRDRASATAAGPDAAYVRDLAQRLLPR